MSSDTRAENSWRSRKQRKQLFELEKHPVEASPLTQLFLVLTNKTYDCSDPLAAASPGKRAATSVTIQDAIRMGRNLRNQHAMSGVTLEASSSFLASVAPKSKPMTLSPLVEMRSDTAVHAKQIAPIVIPDTIVWENNIPKGWFHFDRRENCVQRRKVETAAVQEALLAGAKYENDVVATLYTLGVPQSNTASPSRRLEPDTGDRETALMHRAKEEDLEDKEAATVHCRFITAAELPSFLFDVDGGSKGSSMLQKFVHSIDLAHVDILQAVWTPGGAIVTRFQNINDLFDERIPLFQRCATVEGRSHHSRCAKLTSRVVEQVKERCMAIAEAFRASCHNRRYLSRMVCHFRMTGTIPIVGEPSQELVFLFCSSCRALPVDAWNRGALHANFRVVLPLDLPILIDEEMELEGRATEFATGIAGESHHVAQKRDLLKGSSMIASFMPSSRLPETPTSTALVTAGEASPSELSAAGRSKRMSWEALQTLYLDYGSIFEENPNGSPVRVATLQRVMSHAVATGDVMGYFRDRKRIAARIRSSNTAQDEAPKKIALKKTTEVVKEALRTASIEDCRAAFLASIPSRALTNAERGELLGLRLREYLSLVDRSAPFSEVPPLQPLRSKLDHQNELDGIIQETLAACRARLAKLLYDNQLYVEQQIATANDGGECDGDDFLFYVDPSYVFQFKSPTGRTFPVPVDAMFAHYLRDRVDSLTDDGHLTGFGGRVFANDVTQHTSSSIVPTDDTNSSVLPYQPYVLKVRLLLEADSAKCPLVDVLLQCIGDGGYDGVGLELRVASPACEVSPLRQSCSSIRRVGAYITLLVEAFVGEVENQLQMAGHAKLQ